MAWFKVDDKLHSHPKWLGLSKGARALWVTAGSWSAANLTDGLVTNRARMACGGSPRDARELVDSGLWDVDPGGWRFHDWDHYQPTRQTVLDQRERNAERLREWRKKHREEPG